MCACAFAGTRNLHRKHSLPMRCHQCRVEICAAFNSNHFSAADVNFNSPITTLLQIGFSVSTRLNACFPSSSSSSTFYESFYCSSIRHWCISVWCGSWGTTNIRRGTEMLSQKPRKKCPCAPNVNSSRWKWNYVKTSLTIKLWILWIVIIIMTESD